jgi:hypothetical protein
MDNQQRNRYLMYRTLSEFFSQNAESIARTPAVISAVADFNAVLVRLEQAMDRQETSAIGKTTKKAEAIERVVAAILPIRAALYDLARKTGRTETKTLANMSEWDLRKRRQTELLEHAVRVHRETTALIEELAPYGIDAETLAALDASIEALRTSINEKQVGVVDRVSARMEIANLIAEADDILFEQLDRLIDLFRVTNPAFFEKYWIARSIPNLGVRHQPPAPAPESVAAPASPPAA